MPPLWKISRELARMGRQLVALPADIFNFALETHLYDRNLSVEARKYDGSLGPSPKTAIYVIYPSSGLQKSHFRTLAYLHEMGYAVQVVSNLPLLDDDRSKILGHCWRYIERPNFGYDFGAYRDGMLALGANVHQLSRLLLINDSTWFPLPNARNWLEDVEALEVDFAGAASHFGVARPEIEDFRSIEWTYSTDSKNFHYGSFALSIRSTILQDPDFVSFWRKLRLSDKKKQTVRRGEIGLTQWVISRGYKHGATFDISQLDRDLEKLETEKLLEIAENLIIPELPRLSTLIKTVISRPDRSRQDLIKLILLAVARQGASYALAPYAIRERGFAFLKKSPVWLSAESAQLIVDLLQTLPGSDDILEEARQLMGRQRN